MVPGTLSFWWDLQIAGRLWDDPDQYDRSPEWVEGLRDLPTLPDRRHRCPTHPPSLEGTARRGQAPRTGEPGRRRYGRRQRRQPARSRQRTGATDHSLRGIIEAPALRPPTPPSRCRQPGGRQPASASFAPTRLAVGVVFLLAIEGFGSPHSIGTGRSALRQSPPRPGNHEPTHRSSRSTSSPTS